MKETGYRWLLEAGAQAAHRAARGWQKMTLFLERIISGINLGSIYAIIALGYTMVYGIARMLNFAHGDIIMVGAYICFVAVSSMSLPPLVGVLLAMVVCTILGVTIERLAYRPLRQAAPLAVLITAIGVSYLLQNLAQLIWTANPKSFLLGAAAQLGIFITFLGAVLLAFPNNEAASIAIIGGADGPTAIYVTSKLAPHMLGPIAVAAYSYMALVPIIQPPIMKLLTTKKERSVVMTQLRPVSKTEKIIFPILVAIVVSLILPSAAPLVGMLMLGNLFRESGVVDRLSKTVQNELINIVTIFLGVTVGATANGQTFLSWNTIKIILLGLCAFAIGTAGGVLFGKIMYVATKGKVNPLIGSAGVSAVPMAARVSQKVGQKENPGNFLLMHAMGPNVAGVIGSAVAAGVLIAIFG